MKIILTGSTGNISRPLAEILTAKKHVVTVISSDPGKLATIEESGASAAIGSLTDVNFLIETFAGADAVYAMIPMSYTEEDHLAYSRQIANNYVEAIKQTGISRVVVLSGWAANLIQSENIEGVFDDLPNVSVTILRPAIFYTNFYFSMDLIRNQGLLTGNYGDDDRVVFVSPKDIADAAAEELLTEKPGQIRYVGSEEMTCNEAAEILGAAIGNPELKWIRITNEQMLNGLKMSGMPDKLAENLVDMQAVMHSGEALSNFHAAGPVMGKVKLRDFAKEFAVAYHSK